MEFMRVSLIDAHHVLEEQTIALLETHFLDEGLTMRIIELEKRGYFAEAGAAHIFRESMEMRGKISHWTRERITTYSSTTWHIWSYDSSLSSRWDIIAWSMYTICPRQGECEQGRNGAIETETIRAITHDGWQQWDDHGIWLITVAVRDDQLVEMELQSTIDELAASLSHKDNLIAIRDDASRDYIVKVRDMKNMIQEREEEYNRKHNELEVEIRSLMRINENESATQGMVYKIGWLMRRTSSASSSITNSWRTQCIRGQGDHHRARQGRTHG